MKSNIKLFFNIPVEYFIDWIFSDEITIFSMLFILKLKDNNYKAWKSGNWIIKEKERYHLF